MIEDYSYYYNNSYDDYEDEDEDYSSISVPLTITMTVIGGYVFMGALLFGVWEGWDALQVQKYIFY